VFHAHGDGGIAIAPENVGIVEPAIGEAGIFGGADKVACSLGLDEALEGDAEFHIALRPSRDQKFDQSIKFLGRRGVIVNRNCATPSIQSPSS
jgi:hypothetical protein